VSGSDTDETTKKITAAKTKNNCKSDLGFDAAID
jgi:hypothetical protein